MLALQTLDPFDDVQNLRETVLLTLAGRVESW